MGEVGLILPWIGEIAQIYAHLLGPSGVFRGHQFGYSKIPKSNLQKTVQYVKNAKNASSNKRAVPKAWRSCQRHGDHDKGMETMPKAWWPCQRHGDHVKGMEIMPKAWRSCQKHGDHVKGMETMPKAWRPCQRHYDHAMLKDFRKYLFLENKKSSPSF